MPHRVTGTAQAMLPLAEKEIDMRTTRNLGSVLTLAAVAAAFSAQADTFMNGQSFYGPPVPTTTSAVQMTLGSRAFLNVDHGTVVTFISEGRTFTWQFDGLDHYPVDIAKIAPPGFPIKPLKIYVAPSPWNRGG